MDFSVVIPTFNAAAFLERGLSSVLAQARGRSVEILVVDDGSTDESAAIAQSFSARSPQVRALSTARNAGPGIARNVGVDHATGTWVCFLDADDALEPGFFDRLAAFESDAVDIIAFGAQIDRDGAAVAERADLSYLTDKSREQILDNFLLNRIDPSVIFHAFRRDFLYGKAIRFRGGLHEDVDYMFRAHQLARGVAVCPDRLYRKHDTRGSIVNTLGEAHVRGYFAALNTILDDLVQAGARDRHAAAFQTGVKNVCASRIVRLLQDAIEKRDAPEILLRALRDETVALLARIGATPAGGFQTKYEMMCDLLLSMMDQARPTEETMAQLAAINAKSWSCYDLHHSVFLAPDEIRTCCKRFFADGELRGDAVLLKSGGAIGYDDILREKKRMHAEINRNESEQCGGCPFLMFSDWGAPLASGIQYMSLEYHSVCNMRCIYCSDVYFGGKKANYDVAHVIETAATAGVLEQCEYVVWGGGEPIVDQAFPELAQKLAQAAPKVRQRVITNATLFSEPLAELMERDQAFIVTSIDAGTPAVFEQVRRYKHFDRVIANLKAYAQRAPQNMLLKYILMEENASDAELMAFADLVEQNGLLACNFQVSCDFKKAAVDHAQIVTLAKLYALLLRKGAHFVFMDDLVWQRLPQMNADLFNAIQQELRAAYPGALVAPEAVRAVAVWGTGAQARLMMQKSWLLRQADIAFFVDPRPQAIGTSFLGKPVRAPEALRELDLPVVIAAVQSAPFIYREMKGMKLPESRIVTSLLL